MQTIIGFDEDYLNFYSIDKDSEKLKFLTKIKKDKSVNYNDMMK